MEGSGKVQKHLGCVQEASGRDSEVPQLGSVPEWSGRGPRGVWERSGRVLEGPGMERSGKCPGEVWEGPGRGPGRVQKRVQNGVRHPGASFELTFTVVLKLWSKKALVLIIKVSRS